ncbi:uncharacterized protein M6B38_308595 [Iris pallida]|uniref:Uncharacterized protein n=1 Tax=Iris pallida TaxID=29817 RepID=A0AAX6HK05_IRIPA|nr:uncharacterized protein M6B38_308595 [Iris pallida]
MFLLLQQMMETQRAQAEASQRQSEASHRQIEMLRQSMENSHQLALAAVERVAPGTVQGPTGQQPYQQQSRQGDSIGLQEDELQGLHRHGGHPLCRRLDRGCTAEHGAGRAS